MAVFIVTRCLEVFPHEEIDQMIKDNYFVVQINLHGSTEITDFDGETLTEAKMARKWGMLFTPTMIFMSKEAGEDKTTSSSSSYGSRCIWSIYYAKYATVGIRGRVQ